MAAATYREKRLIGPIVMPTAETSEYGGPAGGTINAVVRSVRVVNTTGAPITFGLSLCPGGAAGAAANRIIPDGTSVPANGFYVDPDMHEVLEIGDTVSCKASGVGLTVTVNGVLRLT